MTFFQIKNQVIRRSSKVLCSNTLFIWSKVTPSRSQTNGKDLSWHGSSAMEEQRSKNSQMDLCIPSNYSTQSGYHTLCIPLSIS